MMKSDLTFSNSETACGHIPVVLKAKIPLKLRWRLGEKRGEGYIVYSVYCIAVVGDDAKIGRQMGREPLCYDSSPNPHYVWPNNTRIISYFSLIISWRIHPLSAIINSLSIFLSRSPSHPSPSLPLYLSTPSTPYRATKGPWVFDSCLSGRRYDPSHYRAWHCYRLQLNLLIWPPPFPPTPTPSLNPGFIPVEHDGQESELLLSVGYLPRPLHRNWWNRYTRAVREDLTVPLSGQWLEREVSARTGREGAA